MSLNQVSTKPRIAIAGATGRVGATITASLADGTASVLALTRDPANVRFPEGIDVGAVDFDAPNSLRLVLEGIERLFIAHGTSPRQVDNEIALIDAAVSSGVKHIVKLSTFGPPTMLHPTDWHMKIEAHLATKSVGYTVLRPTAFSDVLLHAGSAVASGTWGGASGNGLVNFIDTRDVAEVARVALLEGAAVGAQRAFHLTGPKAWSMPDVAEELTKLLGRAVTYQHRTPEQQGATLIAAGLDVFFADLLLGLDRAFRDSALSERTFTVEELTGHPPRSLTAWLSENITSFKA